MSFVIKKKKRDRHAGLKLQAYVLLGLVHHPILVGVTPDLFLYYRSIVFLNNIQYE
jgi:hypothetical protein